MANLYISEYRTTGFGMPGHPADLALEPVITDQKVSFTTATQSAAFNAGTRFIRLIADADCHVLFGAAPTATAANQLLKSNTEYWRAVESGEKVSVYDGSS